MKLGDT